MGISGFGHNENSYTIDYAVPHLLFTDHFTMTVTLRNNHELTDVTIDKIARQVLENQIEGEVTLGDADVSLISDRSWIRKLIDKLGFALIALIDNDFRTTYDLSIILNEDFKEKQKVSLGKLDSIKKKISFVDKELEDVIVQFEHDFQIKDNVFINADRYNQFNQEFEKLVALITSWPEKQKAFAHNTELNTAGDFQIAISHEKQRRNDEIQRKEAFLSSVNFNNPPRDSKLLSVTTSYEDFDVLLKKYDTHLEKSINFSKQFVLKNQHLIQESQEKDSDLVRILIAADLFTKEDIIVLNRLEKEIRDVQEKQTQSLVEIFNDYIKLLKWVQTQRFYDVQYEIVDSLLNQAGIFGNYEQWKDYLTSIETSLNPTFRLFIIENLREKFNSFFGKINLQQIKSAEIVNTKLNQLLLSINELDKQTSQRNFLLSASQILPQFDLLLSEVYKAVLADKIEHLKNSTNKDILEQIQKDIDSAFELNKEELNLDATYKSFKTKLNKIK